MKRFLSSLKSKADLILLVFAATLVFTIPEVLSGCATTPQGKVVQAEAIIVPSVDVAMTGWAAYVQSGRANRLQVNAVHKAFDVYYTTQLQVKAALENSLTATGTGIPLAQDNLAKAQASANDAKAALIALIAKYQTK
jgi:hypothetical protein